MTTPDGVASSASVAMVNVADIAGVVTFTAAAALPVRSRALLLALAAATLGVCIVTVIFVGPFPAVGVFLAVLALFLGFFLALFFSLLLVVFSPLAVRRCF